MSKSQDNDKDDNAEYNKSQGEDEIKTSCIFCKFKPNYSDAIPSFQKAADQYHGQRNWEQEIYCRIRLATCFKETNSKWEEGNEYQKIALIQLNQLSKKDEAYNNILNAHQCFHLGHEYESSIKCLIKMANEYKNRNEYDYAEKTLKAAYDHVLKVFHVISLSNNDDVNYVFELIDAYLELMLPNNSDDGPTNTQFNTKIKEVADTFIKLLKEDSKYKEQISHLYGLVLCYYLIIVDMNSYSELLNKIESDGYDNEEIHHVEDIKRCIESSDEKQFKSRMIDLQGDFPNWFCQKINKLFRNNIEKGIKLDNIKVKVNQNELDDWR